MIAALQPTAAMEIAAAKKSATNAVAAVGVPNSADRPSSRAGAIKCITESIAARDAAHAAIKAGSRAPSSASSDMPCHRARINRISAIAPYDPRRLSFIAFRRESLSLPQAMPSKLSARPSSWSPPVMATRSPRATRAAN